MSSAAARGGGQRKAGAARNICGNGAQKCFSAARMAAMMSADFRQEYLKLTNFAHHGARKLIPAPSIEVCQRNLSIEVGAPDMSGMHLRVRAFPSRHFI